MANGETPSLYETIRTIFESRLADLHTCMPGTIVSFDPATCLATVQPSLKRKYVKDAAAKPLPQIPNVPVAFPRGGGAAIKFDLQKGDEVLLHFAERSIDAWINTGGLSDPKDPRKHALADAFAYAGGHPKNKPIDKEKIVVSFTKDGDMQAKNAKGFYKLDKDGNFTIDNGGITFKFGKDGKFSAKGKSSGVDFVAQLLALIDLIMTGTKVMTLSGPQPFVPDPTYPAERAKLDPFKE